MKEKHPFLAVITLGTILSLGLSNAWAQVRPETQPQPQAQPQLHNKARAGFTYDWFSETFSPWREYTVSLKRQFDRGSVIGRLNTAERFSAHGTQYELDAYPQIKKGTYAYLNGGISNSSVYPKVRIGAELFHNFPDVVEASLGVRYLKFTPTEVAIYTASVARYQGDYYIALRPYVTPSNVGSSVSGSATARRYWDAERYVSLYAGAGSAVVQRESTLEVFRLATYSAGIDGRTRVGDGFYPSVSVTFTDQEWLPQTYRTQWTVGTAIEKEF